MNSEKERPRVFSARDIARYNDNNIRNDKKYYTFSITPRHPAFSILASRFSILGRFAVILTLTFAQIQFDWRDAYS